MEQSSDKKDFASADDQVNWNDVHLLWAAIRDDRQNDAVIYAHRNGPQPPNVDGRTALMYAAFLGKAHCVDRMFAPISKEKFSIVSKDATGRTVLHWAAIGGSFDVAERITREVRSEYLYEFALIKDRSGNTAVDIAIDSGHFGVVSAILKFLRKDDLTTFCNGQIFPRFNGNELGILAAFASFEWLHDVLPVAFKAAVAKLGSRERDWLGRSPLHIAAILCQPGAVAHLLSAGHDPKAIDANLSTPLIACFGKQRGKDYQSEQLEIAKLLAPVTDVFWSDRNGMTALMYAAHNGQSQAVEFLLPLSDANAMDKTGKTALVHMRAMQSGTRNPSTELLAQSTIYFSGLDHRKR